MSTLCLYFAGVTAWTSNRAGKKENKNSRWSNVKKSPPFRINEVKLKSARQLHQVQRFWQSEGLWPCGCINAALYNSFYPFIVRTSFHRIFRTFRISRHSARSVEHILRIHRGLPSPECSFRNVSSFRMICRQIHSFCFHVISAKNACSSVIWKPRS